MIPVIALIGRPNVGKSSLFNKITNTRDALVAPMPGVTRDRKYAEVHYKNSAFILIDTGGVGLDDEEIDKLIGLQVEAALKEADAIFFVVDAREGINPIEQNLSNILRKLEKPIYLIINKIDGLNLEEACLDFYSLGLSELFPTSAAHGLGIDDLLSNVINNNNFKNNILSTDTLDTLGTNNNSIKVACVGRPNVGKSTLINRILGEERVVVCDLPGTTRDSLFIPFKRQDVEYTLIDTAGVRKRRKVHEAIEKFSIIKTLQAIKAAEVCLLLIDATVGITDADLNLLSFIIESGKALIIVINKWDGLDSYVKTQVREGLERKLNFAQFAKIRFISAKFGSGVGDLFKDIIDAYASATKKLSTPRITRILQELVTAHEPPLINGRRVKLRYAHLGGHNPPIIVIHGNQVNALSESYKKYLTNALLEKLELVGTPIKLEFKSSQNPYKDKKNKLTPKQIEKRKRLIKHVKKAR